jgi:hypothetical protein
MSSCFGLVRTVENRGYLYATRARGPLYQTQRLLSLARTIAAHDPLTSRVASALGALRDTCGETVVVRKIRGDVVMLLEVFESQHEIRYFPQIGALRPLHANSMGKAVLGAMPNEERYDVSVVGPAHRMAAPTLKAYAAALMRAREKIADVEDDAQAEAVAPGRAAVARVDGRPT